MPLGEKPERSGRKSNLPVELLLHADCLDVKEFILLNAESTEDTSDVQVALQEFDYQCNDKPVTSLEDPEDANKIFMQPVLPLNFFAPV